ncbi:hydroxymethylglutaryl-CoA lyase [Reinekea sp. G2M2-21]|uniref:hydroxymethylglutaryl-CoA lyase n=1 Tax=Reinekea sp. G2M2-21 TaxID=2788942 RepID=UPI0018AA40BD|nr:hydroxymethylglutaryl-CoA lyase [Reinekea sp. G2M2-21]
MTDVKLVEVGPRDGLQNEATVLSASTRVELIERLANAGLRHIEAGSFVSPKWVPQMAGSADVLQALLPKKNMANVHLPVLTPNVQGYQLAREAGAREVAIFGAASETFSQKNINCSIAESLQRFEAIQALAHADNVALRGYVSCLVACPYEGDISPAQVIPVVRRLFELGCYEVSLGDTIGRGTPHSVRRVLRALLAEFPAEKLALHLHDTYGMAVANLMTGLELGIRTIDASVGGAGGCPYANGASGNVATEEVVYLLEREGLDTGVNLNALVDTGHWLYQQLGKPVVSRVNQALFGKQG